MPPLGAGKAASDSVRRPKRRLYSWCTTLIQVLARGGVLCQGYSVDGSRLVSVGSSNGGRECCAAPTDIEHSAEQQCGFQEVPCPSPVLPRSIIRLCTDRRLGCSLPPFYSVRSPLNVWGRMPLRQKGCVTRGTHVPSSPTATKCGTTRPTALKAQPPTRTNVYPELWSSTSFHRQESGGVPSNICVLPSHPAQGWSNTLLVALRYQHLVTSPNKYCVGGPLKRGEKWLCSSLSAPKLVRCQ